MAARERLDSHEQYTVAWIAALPHERAAATAMLDERHEKPTAFEQSPQDTNAYTWGRIGNHNIVIASLPAGEYGTTIAATTANTLRFAFPHIRLGLMVGIGAGVPQSKDVRLGDVVVSQPSESSGGVVQYDLNKARQEGRFLTGHLAMPPEMLRNALAKLQAEHDLEDSTVPSILEAMVQKFPKMDKQTAGDPRYTHPGVDNDRLFASWSPHLGGADCDNCTDTVPRDRRRSTNPEIHYGVIASGNTLVKTAEERKDILERLPENLRSKCLCIEMEAAGLMNTFPCIVIRGICDYADSHKNDKWQKYAAATAAAFAKEFLGFVDAREVKRAPGISQVVEKDPFNIPFGLQGVPVGNFVGREEQLQQIEQKLQPTSTEKSGRKVFVVHGLGGMGKTQIAAKYARDHQDDHSAVFWIDGSSQGRLQQSFLDVAKRIPRAKLQADVVAALESAQVDLQAVMRGVLQWLSLPGNWKWLLIIDNVDREFRGPGKDEQGFDPKEAMPHSDHGSILITSRLSTLQQIGESLPLGRVNDSEAKEILELQAGRPLKDIHLLIAKLNGLPLALAQAGSFIGMTGLDVKTYIEYFDRTWSDLMKKQDQFPLQDYGERSMLTTWKISYDQVLRRSETTAWLLRLWAFFHHDDFWFGIMVESVEILLYLEEGEEFDMPTWLAELSGSELEFSSAMGLLKAYSLAESTGEGSYTMHSVLHRWSRSLSLDADAASLIVISICVLASASPSRHDAKSWKLELRLLQHVMHACNELRVTPKLTQQEFPSRLTSRLGFLLEYHEELDESEQMHRRALSAKEKVLGPNDWSTLYTFNVLGLLCLKQGKLDEAEQIFQRARLVSEKEFGTNDTSTLSIVCNLGVLCLKQGKLDEAEQILKRTLLSYEEECGPDHKSTFNTLGNLGNLYSKQGKLDKAEQMYQRALAIQEKALGPNHKSTLDTTNEIGDVYRRQGKLDEAERMFERVLTSDEKTYGKTALEVIVLSLKTQNNLGNLYHNQGKLDEAEKMLRITLAEYETCHGKNQLSIPLLTSVYSLGLLCQSQGRLDEAEEMYERALAGYQERYGHSAAEAAEWLASIRSNILALDAESLSAATSPLAVCDEAQQDSQVEEGSSVTRPIVEHAEPTPQILAVPDGHAIEAAPTIHHGVHLVQDARCEDSDRTQSSIAGTPATAITPPHQPCTSQNGPTEYFTSSTTETTIG